MGRNKYPEVTVEKIMEVSRQLFLQKGYDNTTIQDIVNELGGLTRGAIYHHFKSKEEILDALGTKMFFDNNPFTIVRHREDLNGIEKMREVIKINHADSERLELGRHSIPLLKNPRLLAGMIDTNRRFISPMWLELIEEGTRDGSIKTNYAREISELLPLLTNLWLAPSVYPMSVDGMVKKFICIGTMLDVMGVSIINDEIKEIIIDSLNEIEIEE